MRKFGVALCVVAVLVCCVGHPAEAVLVNVAPTGTASQSSQLGGYGAELAIDFNYNNFTHTNAANTPAIWEVNFGVFEYPIEQIVLHNRKDCCSGRLRDITITLHDPTDTTELYNSGVLNPGNILNIGPNDTLIATLPAPTLGGIVRVTRTPASPGGGHDEHVLSLAEVEAFADDANQSRANPGGMGSLGALNPGTTNVGGTPVAGARVVRIIQNKPAAPNPLQNAEVQAIEVGTGTNLALAGTASQSSQLGGFGPGNAIDNNFGNFHHTLDGQGQWWQVELTAPSTLESVNIFSRVGCCNQGRSADLQLQIYDDAALSNLLFDQRVLGIGTSDSRVVPTVLGGTATAALAGNVLYRMELNGDTLESDVIEVLAGPLNVGSELIVAGTLELVAMQGSFDVGDTFRILSADQISGAFDDILQPDIGRGLFFDTTRLLTAGTVTVVTPEPATLSLLALGGLALLRRRRRR